LIFASLYQDKEDRKKSKLNEENTFKDSVSEISGFYPNDGMDYLVKFCSPITCSVIDDKLIK